MIIFLSILGAWLLADFMAGVIHWAQDKLLDIETAFDFLNTFKEENDLHHSKPAAMLKYTAWKNMEVSAMFTWPLSLMLFCLGAPLWLWLAVFFSAFGNVVHRFAHIKNSPAAIAWLQKVGIFCSFDHHRPHHLAGGKLVAKEFSTRRYCVMTNWLNPILDSIRFWRLLELIFNVGAKNAL